VHRGAIPDAGPHRIPDADPVWATGSPAAIPVIDIAVLGALTVSVDDVPVDPLGPRARAVLATLALHAGHPVATSTLVDRVWGEAPPPSVRNTLQTHVAHVRQALEPGRTARTPCRVLTTVGDGYLLALPRDAVDAHRFECLVRTAGGAADAAVALDSADRALALWRGTPLQDGDGAALEGDRRRLGELLATAQRARAGALSALGDHDEAVAASEVLVGEHPYDEAGWALLMQALYRAGRQAHALAAYQRARTVLREELGIDPSPQLRDVEAAVLAQDPALAAPGAARAERPHLQLVAATAREEPDATCEGSALASTAGATVASPLRVVVAEDHLLVREGLRRVLDADGRVQVVALCGSADELLAAIDAEVPDVVVTDIRMPPTFTDEGVAVARALRASHPEVAVLVLSQYVEPAYARQVITGGGAGRGYLLKASVVRPDQLATAIRAVADGGSYLDPVVVEHLLGGDERPEPCAQ
jgi:SARP family transcriptional regulator, regulator of embCAB operon